MNTREVFGNCYRLMRASSPSIKQANELWGKYHPIYKAASTCHVMQARDFSGWTNRDRQHQFFRLKFDLFERKFHHA